ncbi:UpxY family transcription antiterminator [candidate division KSB1 bacterium]|nr:UpxY family transcription antiterminator [candidate division KSB1 bacterium]
MEDNLQKIPQWYAFVTRPRHEKKVKQYLDMAGIDNYLPLKKTLSQWKDRKKWVELPIFSCYIFSHIEYVRRYDVLKAPSVVRIVGFEAKPTPVKDDEISGIKNILESKHDLAVVDGFLAGDRVRLRNGPLAGMEGLFVEYRNRKWFVIYITALSKSVLVDIESNYVEKIPS